jgi:hypothetical protein
MLDSGRFSWASGSAGQREGRIPPPGGLVIGVGIFRFDAFAFTDVSVIFRILLALGASLLLDGAEEPR